MKCRPKVMVRVARARRLAWNECENVEKIMATVIFSSRHFGWDEWPVPMINLDRDKDRGGASGAPVFAKLAYDDRFLYVAVNVAMFDVKQLRKNSNWGEDDGAEISIAGQSGTYISAATPEEPWKPARKPEFSRMTRSVSVLP
jgi:hypothetical protein